MADLFDYLKWRSDVPFSIAPFNDVDNLILAELAYSDFSSIVPSDGKPLPLTEVCERFFEAHSISLHALRAGRMAPLPHTADISSEKSASTAGFLPYTVSVQPPQGRPLWASVLR